MRFEIKTAGRSRLKVSGFRRMLKEKKELWRKQSLTSMQSLYVFRSNYLVSAKCHVIVFQYGTLILIVNL